MNAGIIGMHHYKQYNTDPLKMIHFETLKFQVGTFYISTNFLTS